MTHRHVMIDLETMGLRPNAAIISIGAVYFDKSSIHSEFYTPVSLSSCLEVGLTQDQSTIDWWMKQSVEARMAWQTSDAPSLLDALSKFSGWLRTLGSGAVCPWGNGADFDLTIIGSAYKALDSDLPWKYYHHHCFRTMKNLFRVVGFPRLGTHHNALDDAKHQAIHLQRILQTHNIELP